MNSPDTTRNEILGILSGLVPAIVVLFKLNLTDAQQAAAITLLGAAVTLGLFIADAWKRSARAKALGAQGALDLYPPEFDPPAQIPEPPPPSPRRRLPKQVE